MSRHLFIGGPADGEWRDVDADALWWSVTEWSQEIRATPYDPVVDGLVTGRVHHYIRRFWRDDEAKILHTFYVHSSVKTYEVFPMLVSGYRKA